VKTIQKRPSEARYGVLRPSFGDRRPYAPQIDINYGIVESQDDISSNYLVTQCLPYTVKQLAQRITGLTVIRFRPEERRDPVAGKPPRPGDGEAGEQGEALAAYGDRLAGSYPD
jgi:hypothetical protein